MPTRPMRYLHPSNLVSYLSLLAALAAVGVAKELQSWSLAGGFLAVCAVADTLDGRFARLFPRTSLQAQFGVQLDSLADAVTFGLTPVVALYLLLPFHSVSGRLVWLAAALFYVVTALTRLGFYNLHLAETPEFVGLPTTVAGLIWSTAFLGEPSAGLTGALLIACGAAMISVVRLPRPRGAGTLAFLGWGVVLALVHGLRSIP